MRIEIYNKDDILDIDFGNWLCSRISHSIYSQLDRSKLQQWSSYLNDSGIFKSDNSVKNISAKKLFDQICKNICCYRFPSLLCIEVDKNINAFGLSNVKLSTVCNLITFGNQDQHGYPIILQEFQYVAEHIDEFVEKYMDGVI